MNHRSRLSASIALCLAAGAAQAAVFSYHGQLQDGGRPADGNYDLELTLYSAAGGGRVLGGPLTLVDVPVHRGAIDTQADFGALAVDAGATAWLGVRVRAAGDSQFAALAARSPVAAAETTSVCPGAWTLFGNAGNPGASFLGTTDLQPLSFDVNNLQAGQLVASTVSGHADAPNVKFGASGNAITAGLYGVTIGGGGDAATQCGGLPCTHSATGNLATIGGGSHNTAALRATVAGGKGNQAIDKAATIAGGAYNIAGSGTGIGLQTVGGGVSNQASGVLSTISGGNSNFAEGGYAVVGGGVFNDASGLRSTIPGGSDNFAGGDYSMALGTYAAVRGAASTPGCAFGRCGDFGTFVWADVQANEFGNLQFASTGPNQFDVRAGGGAGINRQPFASNVELTIAGSDTAGVGDNNVDLVLMPRGSTQGFDIVASGTTASHSFAIYNTAGFGQVLGLDGSGNLTVPGNLTVNGVHAYKGGSLVWEASDARIKEDIEPLDSPLARLVRLRPVTFHYTPEYRAAHGGFDDQSFFGFIAQEYANVFPQAVASEHEPVPGSAPDAAPLQSIDIQPALITTVAAVQELARNEGDLRGENARLRDEVKALSERLARLEARER